MARLGHIERVDNKDRKFGAAASYLALNVEDEDGSNERWLLFTEKEWGTVKAHNAAKLLKGLKEGRLYRFDRTASARGFICVIDGEVKWLSEGLLAKGLDRASENKEDLPSKGWLRDLLD